MFMTVVAALAVAVIGLLTLFWWAQERMVFQPPRLSQHEERGATRVDFQAADGQRLFGLLVGEPELSEGVMIVFHGNADIAARQLPWAKEVVRRTGWAVLLAEYRGYAGLEGRPTAAGVRLDARAAYDAAVGPLAAEPAAIALYGHSLGTPVAAELAADLSRAAAARTMAARDTAAEREPGTTRVAPPRALLLESPFTSAREMARRFGPSGALLARAGLVRFHWDTEARVQEVSVPVAVAHGARDNIIPVGMGRRVHASAAVRGPLLIVAEAGHNDVALQAGEEYWQWLRRSLGVADTTHVHGSHEHTPRPR
jgi:uncharacterized protein